jgi:hypothetical protein
METTMPLPNARLCSAYRLEGSEDVASRNRVLIFLPLCSINDLPHQQFVYVAVHLITMDSWVGTAVRSSALQKVYNKTEKDARVTSIHPYLMNWPPSFPQLKE